MSVAGTYVPLRPPGLADEEEMFLEVVDDLARSRVLPRSAQIEEGGIPEELRGVLDGIELEELAFTDGSGRLGDGARLGLLTLERLAWASASLGVDLASRQAGFLAAATIGGTAAEGGTLLALPMKDGQESYLIIGGSGGENLLVGVPDGAVLFAGPKVPQGMLQRRLGLHGLMLRSVVLIDKQPDTLPQPGMESALSYLAAALAACSAGVAGRAIEVATAYASERRQFGKSIIEFGAIESGLAAASARIDSCLAPLCGAVEGITSSRRDVQGVAEHCLDLAVEACDLAIQIHGGYGYIEEYEPERLFRDSVTIRALLLGIRDVWQA